MFEVETSNECFHEAWSPDQAGTCSRGCPAWLRVTARGLKSLDLATGFVHLQNGHLAVCSTWSDLGVL